MLGRTMMVAAALAAVLGGAPAAAGEIRIGGTGAAHGVAERLGEAFAAAHPGESVEIVPSMGSSGGIQAVIAGALQVSFSGRPLKADERAKGLQEAPFVDTPYAFVSSHPKPQALTLDEVVAILGGALTRWPDGRDISPILRPKGDSDTGYLIETVPGAGPALERLRQRPDVPIAGTDQDNIEAAQKTPHSFTGATLMQVVTETPRVKVIRLGGVVPTVEGMERGDYPLKRRLYVMARAEPSEGARRFLDFLRSPEAVRIIRESGAVAVIPRTASAQ